jgi:hypothetical protein
MPLLIDIEELTDEQTDRALDELCKATHEGGDDGSIWDPVDSPFIRRLVELFTKRGLWRLSTLQTELVKWLDGRHHPGGTPPERPEGSMYRWTPGELQLVKLYLETLPPEQFTLDDHMMLVDYLVQRYLPEDDLRSEAEWLAVRATLMGRVQANMEKLTAKQADKVLAALPVTVKQAEHVFQLDPVQRNIINFARVRAAENVSKLADATRHRMRDIIAQHVEVQYLKQPGVPDSSLQTKLQDEFLSLNRDWRRIAVTEAVEASNQGFIASQKPGSKVKRIEQYKGACPFCRKIDGMVLEVVPASQPYKNDWTMVWTGKTNVGRSAAPRRRQGGLLIAREPEEMWAPAAGAQHPHCRGRWLPTIEGEPGDDKEFGDWLRATLGGKSNGTDIEETA